MKISRFSIVTGAFDQLGHTGGFPRTRQRFNLSLSFKRIDQVKITGYEGNVLVCAVMYNPIAGHDPRRYAIQYLQRSKDMETWFAPIAATSFLAPVRVSIPTLIGNAVLQATQFEVRPATYLRHGSRAPVLCQQSEIRYKTALQQAGPLPLLSFRLVRRETEPFA